MTKEILYMHSVSQPSRAVQWLCWLNNHEGIEYQIINTAKGESRSESFMKINPNGQIPVLKDGDFILPESHAIMLYLCEKHGWKQFYPDDLKTRARIHEYMNWHHQNARLSSQVFMNQLLTNTGRATPSQKAQLKKSDRIVTKIMRILEFWLRHGNSYIVSDRKPTVADLSCYNEVYQLEVMGWLPNLEKDYPKTAAWMKRMKSLPRHDELLQPMHQFFDKFKLSKL